MITIVVNLPKTGKRGLIGEADEIFKKQGRQMMNIPMTVEDVRRWMTYLLWQSADIVFYTYKFSGNENNKFIDPKRKTFFVWRVQITITVSHFCKREKQ
jgi:hypothetical protein